jgi:hypothetical protein
LACTWDTTADAIWWGASYKLACPTPFRGTSVALGTNVEKRVWFK